MKKRWPRNLEKDEEEGGEAEPLPGEEEHVGEEGQLVEGGEEVEELGPGHQVLAQVVRVEITEALDHKAISYTNLYRE